MSNANLDKKVIIIMGATATGKSEFAVSCAEKLNGEIISADSMQIYKELNIGTAKISKDEMKNIPHHLINIKHFDEDYNVWQFVEDCKNAIQEIISKNKMPIIVGGTNLYINALIRDYKFNNIKRNEKLRIELNKFIEENGIDFLYEKLKEINPQIIQKINKNDKSRIIREIECAVAQNIDSESSLQFLNNEKLDLIIKDLNSSIEKQTLNIENQNMEKIDKTNFKFNVYALDLPREILYERINKRVDKMIDEGLFDEVISLKNQGLNLKMQSGKGIGYKEILAYLDNELTYESAVEKIKQHSRNFAKRQYTWLRSIKEIVWLDALNQEQSINIVLKNENVV